MESGTVMEFNDGVMMNGDCLELMKEIPSGSVDMILCDLPYGTTACKWDTIIPFAPLWEQYWRVAKPNAAIVLTASQPFTTSLIGSQIDKFRYEWIWIKNLPTGFATAKIQPMKSHENICVFYRKQPIYNKQDTVSNIRDRKKGKSNGLRASSKNGVYGNLQNGGGEIILKENVSPRSTLEINCVPRATGTLHPTQKPVALFEYLIKTYTNPGETVLDNCSGSGTTAIAAMRTDRHFICMEKDKEYYEISCKRVEREYESRGFL